MITPYSEEQKEFLINSYIKDGLTQEEAEESYKKLIYYDIKNRIIERFTTCIEDIKIGENYEIIQAEFKYNINEELEILKKLRDELKQNTNS